MKYKFSIKIILLTAIIYLCFIAYETITTEVLLPPTSQTKKSTTQPLWVYSLQNDKIHHLIIGDSFVKNTYNNYSDGFTTIINNELENNTKKTIVTNTYTIGINTIDEAFLKVQSDHLLKLVPNADLITLSIGFEDFLPLFEGYSSEEDANEMLQQTIQTSFDTLEMLVQMIRSQNPSSLIITYDIYYPLWFDEEDYPFVSSIVSAWNNNLKELSETYSPFIVIPLSNMFTKGSPVNWTDNEVYPNDAGIELMSEWTLKEIISTPLPSAE